MLLFDWAKAGGFVYESNEGFPTRLSLWDTATWALPDRGTHFGFVLDGPTKLRIDAGEFPLQSGMYFCVAGRGCVQGGRGIVATRFDTTGFFSLGGPVEARGRLRYIDGCSDSLLVPPVIQGDPCLNLLHIPPHTHQTAHTHPSVRFGVILSGRGYCRSEWGDTPETIPLNPGMAFVIPPDAIHSFHTDESDLLVVAWHPDSDTGPSHDDHPMVNRTMVNGVSAANIPEIRT